MMNVISPRVFEAIALRTALVLFPGEYAGALEPERHYIPLQKDFSNFAEVVERLRDTAALERLTGVAFDEIIGSERYSIARFVERFDRALDEHGAPRARRHRQLRYRAARRERPPRLKVERTVGRARRVGGELFRGCVKVALALGLVARERALRRLLRLYVADLVRQRAVAAPVPVLEDLLKLALLRRLRTGTPPLRVAISTGEACDELIVRSLPAGSSADGEPTAHPRDPRRVIWDHSAIGSSIRWPLPLGASITVAIGDQPGASVHEFVTLPALAVRFPRAAADALR
jgi:hypothetical protein